MVQVEYENPSEPSLLYKIGSITNLKVGEHSCGNHGKEK